MMCPVTVHDRPSAGAAHGALDRLQPIDAAVAAAKVAVFHLAPRAGCAALQLTRPGQFEIAGLHYRL